MDNGPQAGWQYATRKPLKRELVLIEVDMGAHLMGYYLARYYPEPQGAGWVTQSGLTPPGTVKRWVDVQALADYLSYA